jgi:hypothetical protein
MNEIRAHDAILVGSLGLKKFFDLCCVTAFVVLNHCLVCLPSFSFLHEHMIILRSTTILEFEFPSISKLLFAL